MNGLSDVRLSLRGQELEAEHEWSAATLPRSVPPGLSTWGLYWHRLRTRKALLELTATQLRDVGLSPEQARAEGLKPFWRL
ncbi:DUF1127 domain-containing protein [Pseudomonas sp. TKO26]|uniref:Uncharacterized conserved protein YjiS, DUF1127 family n=1 Tax=Pseudomonas saponiphila TaxID=556534 RepID=A0A1H4UN23_9PSED|nr:MULTISPECIES: DUF1127 domain-containing protein [Pseudomonas]PYY80034.1 DUF1127 domain-containing protein [Pseudomonas sp. TKO30]PYY81339.1 DUF1127 domain-containing protein [Pseudomonas sp. TKO29]PYY83183.1 DUF1127 domain-containing protein [Pseudomonas sp. TKO26]PYY97303.1 DUF1127 domain-containing protein [Pseudomonas sp. TKO14]SEC69798.1 Uncharacterized conserved protein YjiS, DUF1127 family [Pseudomonas saponiphila]